MPETSNITKVFTTHALGLSINNSNHLGIAQLANFNTNINDKSPRSRAPQKIVPNAQVSFNLLRGNMLGAVDLTVSDQARKLVAAAH